MQLKMSNCSTRTYQTRIPDSWDEPLSAYALLMSHVEHSLFADIAAGKMTGNLKTPYLTKFQITARQFNATRINLEGQIDSIFQLLSQRIETKKQQIIHLEETITRLKNKKISLCFGTKKLFRAQFDLERELQNSRAQKNR